jgi:hypothetical protein
VFAEVPHLDLAALDGAVLDVAPLVDRLLPAVLAAGEVDGEGAAGEQVDLEDAVGGEIGRLGGGVGRIAFLEVTNDDGALADLETGLLDALADGLRSISGDIREWLVWQVGRYVREMRTSMKPHVWTTDSWLKP